MKEWSVRALALCALIAFAFWAARSVWRGTITMKNRTYSVDESPAKFFFAILVLGLWMYICGVVALGISPKDAVITIEVIDRANESGNESEIPFVSVVLAAKANRDQSKAALQTFWTAIASLVVALFSLISSVFIYSAQAGEERTLKAEITSLSAKYEALLGRLHSGEINQARLTEQVTVLKKSQAETADLVQTTNFLAPEHKNHKAAEKLQTEPPRKSK